jgi:acetyl-CoA acetyltransferase
VSVIESSERTHRDLCAIAGIGVSEFSKDSKCSELSLATRASLAAINDAGLRASDIDGVLRSDYDTVAHNDLADVLGMANITYWGQSGPGGIAPCSLIGQAVGAIVSGQATAVLVFRSLNGRSGQRYGRASASRQAEVLGGQGTYDEFFTPFGLMTPAQMFALMQQRHMSLYGTTAEEIGAIAIACRRRANANPAAQMHAKPLSMPDYLSARMISRPLCLFDCCLETDGAAAVVVTTTERARDLVHPPAVIRAVAHSSGPRIQPGQMFPALLRDSITSQPARYTAQRLYEMAGLGANDVDVAQLYDCFTITVLMELEDFGFCAAGEGGRFAASGAIELGGSVPINTGGGHLSEGYIHGMNHIVEGVRQIRGTSTSHVDGAEVCLVTSAPPPASSAMMLVVDR